MSRRIYWIWITAFAVWVPQMRAQSASNAFFDDTVVQQISLTVDPSDWAALRANFLDNTYYHAQFSWNGVSMDVGIRQHGGATRSPVKPNLDVNIAHYEKSQSFLGINFFLLKANNGDASNMHETIAMKFYQMMGLPAPREVPAQLYVNGQLFGFFTIVEHEDTNFLERDFGENGGYLYEWEEAASYYFSDLGSDPSLYSQFLDLKTNQNSPDLANFANMAAAINNSSDADFIAAISPYLSPAYYLEYVAIDNVLANSDGILSDPYGINNFYLYQFQNSTLYTFIPWDEDDSFSNAQRSITQDVSSDVLANRLMSIPEYQGIYMATLAKAAQMFGGTGGWATQELNREYGVIAAAAQNDPNKRCLVSSPPGPCPAGAFQTAVTQMQSFIAARSTYVTTQVSATSYQPIANQPSIASLQPAPDGSLVAGTIAIITGQNLGAAAAASSGSFAPVLGSTYVTVNGERAPLSSVAPGEIVLQLPNDATPGAASVVVTVDGVLSNSYSAVIASSPSVPAGGTLLDIDVPGPNAQPFLGTVEFSGWAASETSSIADIDVSVDGVVLGPAQYGGVRNDVCGAYAALGCPNVGWIFTLDTTALSTGGHTLTITSTDAAGQHAALSAAFTVANWTASSNDPIKIAIDTPGANNTAFSGGAFFGGWAIDSLAAIAQVSLSVDGIPVDNVSYGGSRPDVCAARANAPGCPNVGWNAWIDTTYLGDGAHTLALTATTTEGQSTTATASFTVANQTASSPIHLSIGRPNSADSAFNGYAAMGGWAVDDNSVISQVSVSVDGVVWGNAAYGGSRPDVCAAYPNRQGCPNVGWNFILDTTMLADGIHNLSITAYDANGLHLTSQSEFTSMNAGTSGALHLTLENPSLQSAALMGGTTVKGWALNQSSAVTNVSAYVDGVLVGPALYGISRPDVCANFAGATGCPNVGWSFLLDTTKFPDGSHSLAILATSADGSHATTSVPVKIANWTTSNPMRVVIDVPSTQNNRLTGGNIVGGWAIDDLTGIAQVTVAVDGVPVGNATYGNPRPDVCALFPNRTGCPNVGWSLWLDTTMLGDGNHTMQVTATSSAGQSSTTSMAFTVVNLTAASPLHVAIDAPLVGAPVSGEAGFGGWALDTSEPVTSVLVQIDGVLQGNAGSWARPDVCARYNAPGCPDVGWNYYVDTTTLSNGTHTLSITATTASGARATGETTFDVEN
ncbi:MAG TPA: CotH kinase family protein [Bryobacteraceae bacterium]|nr:CotH kinase family protein [Bryobacteraceae bacterium]